jgi:hypothetical protein
MRPRAIGRSSRPRPGRAAEHEVDCRGDESPACRMTTGSNGQASRPIEELLALQAGSNGAEPYVGLSGPCCRRSVRSAAANLEPRCVALMVPSVIRAALGLLSCRAQSKSPHRHDVQKPSSVDPNEAEACTARNRASWAQRRRGSQDTLPPTAPSSLPGKRSPLRRLFRR